MLQVMRKMAHSWPVKALLSLLIVSFGIWGVGDMFRGNPQQSAVAKVGSQKITVLDLEQRFQKDMPEARRAFGEDLSTQQARQLGVLDRALDVLIKYSVIDQEVKRLGLNIPDRLIVEDLAKQPMFRDKDGKFSPALWRNALGKNGLTERLFIEDQKTSSARRMLLQEIVNNAPLPTLFVNNMYRARGAKRILEVLSLKNSSIDNAVKPTDKDLTAYYESHGDSFKAPEYRTMTVGVLSGDEVQKDVTTTEDDIQKAYEDRKEELTHPEMRDLVQVVVQDEARAKALSESVGEKGKLEDAAKAKGLNAVPLKKIEEKSILPALYTTVFSLEEDQTSAPVKSDLGWHVVQVKKIYPAGIPALAEIHDDLRDALKQERAADMVAKRVNQLDDGLAANRPLEDIADSLKLRLIKIPFIDAQGNQLEKTKIESFPAKEDVMHAAFGLGAGESSQVIEDKAGNYVVVRVDDITPSQVRPFDKVKDLVLREVEANSQAEKASAKAEDIAKAVREGKKLSSYAAQNGIEVRYSKPISLLGEMDEALPRDAYAKIIKMKEGDVVTVADKDRQLVLRLSDIHQVDPLKSSPAKIKVIDALKHDVPVETAEEYEVALHKRTPVRIDEELLESLKKQGS